MKHESLSYKFHMQHYIAYMYNTVTYVPPGSGGGSKSFRVVKIPRWGCVLMMSLVSQLNVEIPNIGFTCGSACFNSMHQEYRPKWFLSHLRCRQKTFAIVLLLAVC